MQRRQSSSTFSIGRVCGAIRSVISYARAAARLSHLPGRAANCLVSCDHLPRRSWPLFRAKAMLGDLIAGFSSPGIQSQQEQSAA
jgi:hypothetical protein